MKGERALLRIGEWLVSRACRGLPRKIREERRREWAAELPVILHDPEIRTAPRRAVRMLLYARDIQRAALRAPGRARHLPTVGAALLLLLTIGGLATVIWGVVGVAQAPGHWISYAQVAWSVLLTAWPISRFLRSTARTTGLLLVGSLLAGVAVQLGYAAQAPRDWVNYFSATSLLLCVAAWWLTMRWARMRGRSGQPSAKGGAS